MEVEISLLGLDVTDWFAQLKATLSELEPNSSLVVEQLLPPPGSFGAGVSDTVKAVCATVVGLATIVGAGASVYSTRTPQPTACEVSFETGQIKTKMTFDCRGGNAAKLAEAFAKEMSESLANHAKQYGTPKKVVIRPALTTTRPSPCGH